MKSAPASIVPWYREPWPWILMAGPAAVLIAGAITIWIAFATSDGLVAQDYYRQGLAVNKVLEREDTAARLGLEAEIALAGDRHRIVVAVRGADPRELNIRFAHVTRSGHDLALRLARVGEGRYEAAVAQDLPPGRWNVVVEAPGDVRGDAPGGALGGAWRLAGKWSGREATFTLGSKTG